MWNSVGRSGHHMQYVGNSYDEWEGLSPNGRQAKNQLTDGVRNLSGAEYWHMRKAPIVNSKAPKKAKKEVSLRDSILLANRHLDRLEKLSERLESEYLDGDVSHADYILMRKNLDKRLERAWKRVEKENFYEDEEESLTDHPEQAINIKRNTDSLGIFESLSPDNSFRRAYILLKNFRVKLGKILLILSEDSRGE